MRRVRGKIVSAALIEGLRRVKSSKKKSRTQFAVGSYFDDGDAAVRKAERIEGYSKNHRSRGGRNSIPATSHIFCFNTQEYYEAHDVLEHLWSPRDDESWAH